jgi:uncharacterized OsmC-like protein
MTPDELRSLQAPIKEHYRTSPETALVPMSVTGTLDSQRIACQLPPRETCTAELHPAAGGPEGTLCSGDMLLEALAACAGVTFCAVATAMGIEFTDGTVTASGEVDFRGTLGVDRATPVGMQDFSLVFRLSTTADEEKLNKLLQLTERYCVIYQTLSKQHEISSSIDVR